MIVPAAIGGSLENRTRFMREVIDGIRATTPGLDVAVRLSVFDLVPYRKIGSGAGVPDVDPSAYHRRVRAARERQPRRPHSSESREVLRMLEARNVGWVCVTAGSPYYCPHTQRPALFPPSDGYDPPEDPLHGVARQVAATALLKAAFPEMAIVGLRRTPICRSGCRTWRNTTCASGLVDFVGLGRMVLAYPDFPADLLAGLPLKRKTICRTFSDCTTGPRMGLVSGCFPLDPFYLHHEHGARLRDAKAPARS